MVAKPKPDSNVTKEDLIALAAKRRLMQSAMGEARGDYGKHVAALEDKGFDAKVFHAIQALIKGKNAAGIAARLRCFAEYVELLGLRDQADIEDYLGKMPDTRTELERAMDGEVATDANGPTNVHEFKPKGRGKGKRNKDGSDAVLDGGVPAAPESADDAEARKASLARFREALQDAETPDRVNKGLEQFTADNPALSDDALEIAADRLNELAPAG